MYSALFSLPLSPLNKVACCVLLLCARGEINNALTHACFMLPCCELVPPGSHKKKSSESSTGSASCVPGRRSLVTALDADRFICEGSVRTSKRAGASVS